MILILFFILLIFLIINTPSKKKSGGRIDGLFEHQEKYIGDIQNGNLIFHRSPVTFTPYYIKSFPYIKYFYPYEHLRTVYENIKTTEIPIDYEPYEIINPQIKIPFTKFFGEWITISKEHKGFYFTFLIDYFQEECRMNCKRVNTKYDALTHFNNKKKKASKKIKKPITYLKIMDYIFVEYERCSEFNPIWLTNMFPFFEKHSGKIINMLDMSAGRGARMIACAAKDINYLGVDPCECTNANYLLMKKFVKYCGTKSKIKFVKSGFENNWIMPEFFKDKKFDLMFTSPPYFNLEIYEDTNDQSIKKFSDLKNWHENFLKVCMIKILGLLRPGGIMAINIDNPVHIKTDYVGPMLNFQFDNADYIGVIRIFRGAKFHTWCWQKKNTE